MKKILVLTSALVLCVVLVLAAGCTQPANTTETPKPTIAVISAAATPPASPAAVFSTPGPTQTLPSYWDIEIEVESNGYAPDPQIVTTVRGGQGLSFIQQIDVKVTRTDGIVEKGIIPKPLEVGDFVSLNGTDKNHDR
ncbi:MAG: hypothetical protein LUO90_03310, partial [Methanoregula sp.]|nr:hypothetical protein [Methanoregula sp.]